MHKDIIEWTDDIYSNVVNFGLICNKWILWLPIEITDWAQVYESDLVWKLKQRYLLFSTICPSRSFIKIILYV